MILNELMMLKIFKTQVCNYHNEQNSLLYLWDFTKEKIPFNFYPDIIQLRLKKVGWFLMVLSGGEVR